MKGAGTLDSISRGLAGVFERALAAENLAARPGVLQSLDPRAKVIAVLLLVSAAIAVRALWALAGLFLLGIVLAIVSQVPVGRLARQAWLGVFIFTGLIALPAPFVVPGVPLARLPLTGWLISEPGLRSAALLVARAEVSATIALLLVLTTRWPQVLKGLRAIGLPVAIIAVLGMTHRFIFVLLTTASHMFEARRSRALAAMAGPERRRIIVASLGVLLAKTMALAGETHLAMISRGYAGEVRVIDDLRFRARDIAAIATAAAICAGLLWAAR